MYDLDSTVEAKLVGRSDRVAIEQKLREMPPEQQRRWMANPIVEWLIQSYMNQLVGGLARSATGAASCTDTSMAKQTAAETKPDVKDDDSDNNSDAEGGMFDLFD